MHCETIKNNHANGCFKSKPTAVASNVTVRSDAAITSIATKTLANVRFSNPNQVAPAVNAIAPLAIMSKIAKTGNESGNSILSRTAYSVLFGDVQRNRPGSAKPLVASVTMATAKILCDAEQRRNVFN